MVRKTLPVSQGQADMLMALQRAAQDAQNRFKWSSQAVLAGFDDLPDEYTLATISDDPPELVITYEDDEEE